MKLTFLFYLSDPEYEKYAVTRTFDTIISNTYKKHPQGRGSYTSVREIWTKEKGSIDKATRLMAYLTEDMPAYQNGQLNVSELARVCGLSRPTVYKYLKMMR